MILKHFTLKDADALTAACVEWAWGAGRGTLHNRRITALCHLWLCVVAVLNKTNDGAERRISARSVTDFHWTGTDPIH